ncbi:hypothetical protein HPP92_017324 [Vanilla planifolia]|uniref:ERCC4 domain-containing protein n=1 Tax=Vanilla planifolia TaxID=51239 RepID=A0A835QJ92_VANPL|nr:hypothetical protein HPP92_017324 [Vanilla planifolia]
MNRSHQSFTVDILSDDDVLSSRSPPPIRAKSKSPEKYSCRDKDGGGLAPTILVIDDDPTPQKPSPVSIPSFVAETPLSFISGASVLKCSHAFANSQEEFAGVSSLVCLDSDNESNDGSSRGSLKKSFDVADALRKKRSKSSSPKLDYPYLASSSVGLSPQTNGATSENIANECSSETSKFECSEGSTGDILPYCGSFPKDLCYKERRDNAYGDIVGNISSQSCSPIKQKGKHKTAAASNNVSKTEAAAKKKQLKDEKECLMEERKRKREEAKLQKEALKAETAEMKKLEKEKQKWEKGKLALKSIVAEIDAKFLENGSIGGHLLTRFAEKGLSYQITSNLIERSILWKMTVPEQIAKFSNSTNEVPYIVLLFQAEEFCDLVMGELMDHVRRIRSQYPAFTICYLTNRLMSFINKCEQSHHRNSSKFDGWKRPPVEEALSRLVTHFDNVHSRQCIDEAEVADHIVGLTSSLASCQFRKKSTWLSVNANGSFIPKGFIDRKLIKKNVWLKALAAIPKVQPRHVVAIWKAYPTMRSLLNVYMDPNKTVHEKEFLLKDLMVEGSLGREDRRLGEICSKRIFRILMAKSGSMTTDDVEDGADFFDC